MSQTIHLRTDIDWVAAIVRDYVDGKIEVEQLEDELAGYFRSGDLPQRHGIGGLPPLPSLPDPLKESWY